MEDRVIELEALQKALEEGIGLSKTLYYLLSYNASHLYISFHFLLCYRSL